MTAIINVNSIPTGATVIIDSYIQEEYTNSSYEIDAGEHELKVGLLGYDWYIENFSISEGETKTFDIIFVEVPPLEWMEQCEYGSKLRKIDIEKFPLVETNNPFLEGPLNQWFRWEKYPITDLWWLQKYRDVWTTAETLWSIRLLFGYHKGNPEPYLPKCWKYYGNTSISDIHIHGGYDPMNDVALKVGQDSLEGLEYGMEPEKKFPWILLLGIPLLILLFKRRGRK